MIQLAKRDGSPTVTPATLDCRARTHDNHLHRDRSLFHRWHTDVRWLPLSRRTIEGLLLNSRMIQATFDDENPETVHRWAYPDSRTWDTARNVAEFIEALPIYRDHGLLAVTLNFQGGSPEDYSEEQPYPPSAGPRRRTHTLRFGVVCGQRSLCSKSVGVVCPYRHRRQSANG